MVYKYEVKDEDQIIHGETVADSMRTAVITINMMHPGAHINRVTLIREDSNWRKRNGNREE